MADKIKKSYKFSKHFYDDAITQGKWWSRLYFNLLWGGVDDNEIARRVLCGFLMISQESYLMFPLVQPCLPLRNTNA